jgi:hypothetical protein
MNAVDVSITEVGPRDGCWNTKSFMPTAAKKAWISAEAAAGVNAIEVCSFVPAKLIPQFVDAEEVLAHANAIPGMTPVVLVPNFKGCERALAAGARRITAPISVSEAHSMSNVRKTTAQAVEDLPVWLSAHMKGKQRYCAPAPPLSPLAAGWWQKTTVRVAVALPGRGGCHQSRRHRGLRQPGTGEAPVPESAQSHRRRLRHRSALPQHPRPRTC